MDFDPNVGTVARWFDLTRDPDRRTNLVAEYSRLLNNKFGFKDEEGNPVGGSSYLAPTEVPVLLEASPVRARVRLVCPGARTYGGGAVQTNVQGTTDYTVYPTGRVFVRNELRVVDEPYRSNHFQLNMLTSWAAHNGSNGQAIRSSAKDFILHTHRGGSASPSSPGLPAGGQEVAADALLVWHTGERSTSYFNAPYEWVFYRSGVRLAEAADKTLEPGASLTWCFMLQLKSDDIDSEEAARPYALDYRAPARVTVARGALITDDVGDLNQDGFNEAEGCYVLSAEDGSVGFTLASGEVTHYWPILKVLNWPGAAPANITVNDRELSRGSDFLAHADANVLIIQLLEPVSGDAVFSVAGDLNVFTNDDDAPFAAFVFEGDFASAPNADTVVELYAQMLNIVGGSDEEVPDANHLTGFIGTFGLNDVATNQFKQIVAKLPNGKASAEYQFFIRNQSGFSLDAGWNIHVTTVAIGPHP